MSDALLKNTFNKISPAYELVADVTIATATTQVDFSGLNFGKDDDLLLVAEINNTTASVPSFRLFPNANYTDTNYWTQALEANGTTITGSRSNIASCLFAQANSKTFISAKIKLTNNGYFVFQLNGIIYNGLSTMYLAERYTTSTFTLTSITSLRFFANVANAIGIGSRFQLYRLKAKKVSDIIVSSATTQVDITGLDIDKDSEYMLVSDVVNGFNGGINYNMQVNNNTTNTNYYHQRLTATSTTVSGARNNDAIMSYIDSLGGLNLGITKIKLTNNGYYVSQTNNARLYGTATPIIYNSYVTSTFTMSAITILNIKASQTNAIGIGSRFTLYKMK